jgi:hypothetical protein
MTTHITSFIINSLVAVLKLITAFVATSMSIATTRDCGSRLAIRARSSQYSPLDGNVSSVRCLYRPHRELQSRINLCLYVRCVQCTVFTGNITKCRGTDPLYGRVEVWLHSFFTSVSCVSLSWGQCNYVNVNVCVFK